MTIDYRPRIAELEKQRANLIAAIKSGGLAVGAGRRAESYFRRAGKLFP